MRTRKHVHEEVFPASPERLFALLHTPSAIRHWWNVAHAVVLPERGGFWAAAWGEAEDEPDYITVATIRDFEPPRVNNGRDGIMAPLHYCVSISAGNSF